MLNLPVIGKSYRTKPMYLPDVIIVQSVKDGYVEFYQSGNKRILSVDDFNQIFEEVY